MGKEKLYFILSYVIMGAVRCYTVNHNIDWYLHEWKYSFMSIQGV